MPFFLCLETSTRQCSVALMDGEKLIAQKASREEQYTHSEKLHVFIDSCLKESGTTASELDAIVVSKGPGSYTGLRIGVSAAKGLAYGLDIPVITLESLDILAAEAKSTYPDAAYYIPMIDARRMEVYTQIFNAELDAISKISAEIIDQTSFSDLKEESCCYFGDGAEKCRDSFNERNWKFLPDIWPMAGSMGTLALEKWEKKDFENTAYFEPFYLKEFIAGKPKKLL